MNESIEIGDILIQSDMDVYKVLEVMNNNPFFPNDPCFRVVCLDDSDYHGNERYLNLSGLRAPQNKFKLYKQTNL
jgi:hypothetical protein